MKSTTLPFFRKHLSAIAAAMTQRREALVVTQPQGQPLVVVPLDVFRELTQHRHSPPPRRPRNMETLLASMEEPDEFGFLPAAEGEVSRPYRG